MAGRRPYPWVPVPQREYARNQTELVIIVTPHLVTPTRGEALALPTDRVQPPSERDLFLFGRVAADKAPQTVAPVKLHAKTLAALTAMCWMIDRDRRTMKTRI